MTINAPTGLRPHTIFTCYNFTLYIPERDEVVPLQSCFNDPFTEAVWLGRAHITDEPTLAQRLCEVTRIEILMLPRTQGFGKVRRITVKFSAHRWLPLDLDNRQDSVALEWVALEDGEIGPVKDLTRAELPPSIAAWLSPSHANES